MIQIKYLLSLIMAAVCYFYYNYQFLGLMDIQLDDKQLHKKRIWFTFVVNYSIFTLCSLCKLHLILNWSVFLFVVFLEMLLFLKYSFFYSLFHSLTCTIIGLAVNIFLRSFFAIILKVPASAFDSDFNSIVNLKIYPITIGFFLSGLIFYYIRHSHWKEKVKVIIHDKFNSKFLLHFMLILYGYLCLNLLIYYIPEDYFILTLWGMKSSICVLAGYFSAIWYVYRLNQLAYYRLQNQKIQQELRNQEFEEKELNIIAFTDSLTRCFNRKYLESIFHLWKEKKTLFCLCFIDLDGLKKVNDTLGHRMGDTYITTVALTLTEICHKGRDVLCRYGGDEFLILFDSTMAEAESKMQETDCILFEKSNTKNCPFLLSISYGLVEGDGNESKEELIQKADAMMYERKKQKREFS